MTVPCGYGDSNPYFGNTVSSVQRSALVYRHQSSDCQLIRGNNAFHANRGLMAAIIVVEV